MIHIRTMTHADISVGMRLKREANWNQLDGDFQRILALDPDGNFVAEYDGEPVGTLATTSFGNLAWISMVLVDARMRGKGIGTALMRHALHYLDGAGMTTIRLDATPMGQPIYEKLGFVAEYRVLRYEGTPAATSASDKVSSATLSQQDEIISFDLAATVTDRTKLLHALLTDDVEPTRVMLRDGCVTGYLMARPGSRAWQIGPCIADAASGPLLLQAACHRHAGQPLFLDIPEHNSAAIAVAEALGLTVQRPFLRMSRGPLPVDHAERIWASFGPEKG